jgi:hypothetical protein
MGFFDRLFGRKPAAPAPDPVDEAQDLQPTAAQPIQGPPEFLRAVELQRAYWTHDADEQAQLEARGVDRLSWRETLRLHHLICLQRLNPGPGRAAAAEKCRQTARRLLAPASPYRPRPALVWQGQAAQPGTAENRTCKASF